MGLLRHDKWSDHRQPWGGPVGMVLSRGGTQGYGGDSWPAMILWSGFCPSGLIVVKLWVVFCVFASVKLAKREQTGIDRPWRPPSSHGRHGPPLPTRPHATSSHNILR